MNKETIIVTAASIHPEAAAMLSDYRVVYADVRAGEDALADLCRQEEPVGIMVRYGNISEKVISASSKLRVIAKHGVGTDNIDKKAAERLGIPVTAALGSNSQAVTEHTLGLMFACARKLTWLDARMKQGHWDKDNYLGLELRGATLGLVGAGAIGGGVAAVALALGMQVVVYDPFAKPGSLPEGACLMADLDDLLKMADVISLHCPLTAGTRGLLNRERLASIKNGAIIINTARAGLFDEEALLDELEAGRLVAGIDCFQDEPLKKNARWLATPNAVLTPHIGGTTATAFKAMGVDAAKSILFNLR
jgi:D-3-phosphoglycerate dehydrogenase / 2-oxoglutarate reductase